MIIRLKFWYAYGVLDTHMILLNLRSKVIVVGSGGHRCPSLRLFVVSEGLFLKIIDGHKKSRLVPNQVSMIL